MLGEIAFKLQEAVEIFKWSSPYRFFIFIFFFTETFTFIRKGLTTLLDLK